MNKNQINHLTYPYAVNKKVKKINLFVTVRILLHILSQENRPLRSVAQKVLKDSYKMHQNYPEIESLASLIENGLLEIGGIEKYWARAKVIKRQRGCCVSVKSTCKRKNESVFTVNTGGDKVDLVMPLLIKRGKIINHSAVIFDFDRSN